MIQWVVKLSKLCNLRCSYCYEFPQLNDPARMTHDELRTLFTRAADYGLRFDETVEFVWHGGEPSLLGADYFDEVFAHQRAVFAPRGVRVRNAVQSNLYSIDDAWIEMLRRFNNVGVSLDLFGDLRVNVGGAPTQDRVMRNMDRLRAAGIRFGAITVLTRPVAAHVEEVVDFYSSCNISFRLLPLYRTAFPNQHDGFSLIPDEIDDAFIRAFDRMVSNDSSITIAPLSGWLSQLISRGLGLTPSDYPTDGEHEKMFIVDTPGTVYASANAYMPGYSYGNIFEADVETLLASDGYRRTLLERRGRMEICGACDYCDCCSKQYVAEATPDERHLDPEGVLRCPSARRVQEHIEEWMQEQGLLDPGDGWFDVERIARQYAVSDIEGVSART